MSEAPRHRSSLKQQNKPFKGKSKSKPNAGGRTVPSASHVSEWTEKSKQDRKNASLQKRKHQREALLNKSRNIEGSTRTLIVGLLPLSNEVDLSSLKSSLESRCELRSQGEEGEVSQVFKSPDGSSVIFLKVPRSELAVLDYGKIVDCFLHVFSCKNADLSKVKLDPSSCCAFDEIGYKLLSALKTQGFPPAVGVLQDIEEVPVKRQKEVKKLWNRYFLSEVPEAGKLRLSVKIDEILRDLSVICRNSEEIGFRAVRSYFYAQVVRHCFGFSEFKGVLKGSGLFNVNQLVHVTGVGDFNVSGLKVGSQEFLPDNPENIVCEKDPGPFAAEQTWPNDDDLADAFARLEVKTDHPPCDIDMEEDDELKMSDDEKQVFEFEERKKEDFDFPDEVNTPHDQPAKVRFQKYRGLASFRTSEWDKYENLPPSYSKIYEFKEPCHIVKQSSIDLTKEKSQTSPNLEITIRIQNFPSSQLLPDQPVIISSLLPHERKLSVLHFRLERYGDSEIEFKSKSPVSLHYGFRRISCNPILSEDSTGDKFKYLRSAISGTSFIASIFGPVSFLPSNVLVYKETMEGASLVALGSLQSFDPSRLIIKRILLTGYPLKIHKRKAVIRYMFVNPADIRYFKPIELFTRSGLRGHIKESLGTHGHMKCVFNDFIKHSDIVCLPLYKRVYPKWQEQLIMERPRSEHKNFDESFNDDEIVTFDLTYDDLHPRPPLTEFKTNALENRPNTEQGINRYNTAELFTFEEDDAYSKLNFQEKLTNSKWQVRKKLYMDIADCLRTGKFLIAIESELTVFEYFEPFLKDMAWDSNLTSQLEGLSCILVYVKLVPNVKNSLFFLADELVPKCGLTKQKSGELVQAVIVELMRRDNDGVLLHCIVKRFTAKNPKEACFAINSVKLALNVMNSNENIGKNITNGLNKTLTHSINEVRTASLALALEFFAFVADDAETFVKNLDLKAFQGKEFKDLIAAKVKSEVKWSLFSRELKKNESDLLILEENNENFVVDLNSLVPEGFFDMPYSTEIKVNREKLLRFTHGLESQGLVLEKKEYPNVVNTLLHLIESNNNLIYTESIKILEILVSRIPKSFTFKYKHFIQFLSDKFKEKKKSLINSIFQILHLFRVCDVCSFEDMVNVLLDNSAHKVPQVREYSMNWIASEIQKLSNPVDLLDSFSNSSVLEKQLESLILSFGNKILKVALTDTVGSVRDSASRLLSSFRTFLPSCPSLETLLSRLPKAKSHPEIKKEEEIDSKEPISPILDFLSQISGIPDKDQFCLTMILEDIKRYSEGIFKYELILTNLKKLEKDSIILCRSPLIDSLTSTFQKMSPSRLQTKLETAVLELNLLCESLIREVGSFEDSQLPRLTKLILQFPGFVHKTSHKLIESTLESLFMLSSQVEIISCSFTFIADLRLKKGKIVTEEKALTCLKFVSNWVVKKIDKNIARANNEKFLGFVDFLLDIRENESVFSEGFNKELVGVKGVVSGIIRKALANDSTPSRSRSPNLSISENEGILDVLKEVREIHAVLKASTSSQKLTGLHRLISLVEQVLAVSQKNGKIRKSQDEENFSEKKNLFLLSLEELETFVKDLIFLCTKYKTTQQLSYFEELQQVTINAFTSLRLTLTDLEAETVFKQLLYHLPTKNSSSSFAKSFNLLVYQLFSDWLSHLSTENAIILVCEYFKLDQPFNLHIVYIHVLQWLLEIELKLGNFDLQILDPLSLFLVSGLFGGPLNTSHPLSHNTKQLLIFHSQIFVEYLVEIFTIDNVSLYFEEKLVNSGKLFESFKEWTEKFRENLQEPQIVSNVENFNRLPILKLDDGKYQEICYESPRFKAKYDESVEQHEETRRNLEEVNKEYLNQVTLNYELMQKLEKVQKIQKNQMENREKSTKNEKEVKIEKIEKDFQKEVTFKPYTDLDDLLKTKTEEFPRPAPVQSFFEPVKLDEPVVPFYLQNSELGKFQLKLLQSSILEPDLLQIYKTLPSSHKKPFLQFLSQSLSNPDLFNSLEKPVLKSLFSSLINFCVIEKLASKETGFLIKTLSNDLELTQELQRLLAILMDFHDSSAVVCCLFQIIQEILPDNFYLPLRLDQKHALKLLLKFTSKIVANSKGLRVFSCLFTLFQVFLAHPPESLHSDCSDVQIYEHMFKVLRRVSDALVAQGPEAALALMKFVSSNKCVYVKYLAAVLSKKFNLT